MTETQDARTETRPKTENSIALRLKAERIQLGHLPIEPDDRADSDRAGTDRAEPDRAASGSTA